MYATRMHHAISRICYHMLERIDYVGIPILDLHACHGAVYTCAYQPQDVYIHVEIYILYFTCLLVLACISKQYIHYLYVYIGTGASIGGRSTTAETQLLQKSLGTCHPGLSCSRLSGHSWCELIHACSQHSLSSSAIPWNTVWIASSTS